MTDHPGLLAAILAEPHADDLRLIYADWLEEKGQEERAEFIRVQVEYARLAGGFAECRGFSWHGPDCVAGTAGRIACNRLRALRERTGSILGDPECRHCDWHAPIGHGDAFTWEYRRGFIAAVRCPLAAWEQHGPALVSRHPIERVEATDEGLVWRQRALSDDMKPWTLNLQDGSFKRWLQDRHISCAWFWWHATEAAARDALSRELLAWARQLAEERGLMS